MTSDKWCHFNEWHIRKPDGTSLALNSEAAADYVLGLLDRVTELEAAARKRGQRRRKKEEEDKDE